MKLCSGTTDFSCLFLYSWTPNDYLQWWFRVVIFKPVGKLLSENLKINLYRNIILPVVLYGCETWWLTLREERRLRVFENRVLRRIFGPKRDGVTGEWRKLHNEELNDLYSSPNIVRVIKSRRMRWAVHVARMEEGRGRCAQGFGGETWVKETIGETEM